ncbi:hypothetical protein HETIRDRAFT_164191 [Heterobasidion irregulare TC 32-1]|uniref:Uncharacterized protein n=1 Tax=Heterobasidion irregulare (strain TC 32-1) TaxID=747525 RepID=W4JXD9_HETIT|nr:uncharacterized protein HETIRDRAFT_164191 [Heterobasidion irregulare TC 32-1]ETW78213.1 hypothetical protein HETIRDRAFT_164191 [Heterobasidion irregulare TC 32-1]
MAKGHAFYLEWSSYLDSLQDNHQKLLICIFSLVNWKQKPAKPMAFLELKDIQGMTDSSRQFNSIINESNNKYIYSTKSFHINLIIITVDIMM